VNLMTLVDKTVEVDAVDFREVVSILEEQEVGKIGGHFEWSDSFRKWKRIIPTQGILKIDEKAEAGIKMVQFDEALWFKPLPDQFIKYSIRITQDDVDCGYVRLYEDKPKGKLLTRFEILKMPT
jgi:hypothetical protein